MKGFSLFKSKHEKIPTKAWLISTSVHLFILAIVFLYSLVSSFEWPFFSGNDKPFKAIKSYLKNYPKPEMSEAFADMLPGATLNGRRLELKDINLSTGNGKSVSCPNALPLYPQKAKEMGMEGTVILKVEVSKTGLPISIAIKKSSGHEILDSAAKNAVRTWRFRPAFKAGKPIEGEAIIPIRFQLTR